MVFTSTFGAILSVTFHPSGELLAAGTATGEIWLYRIANGIPLHTYKAHTDGVWALSSSGSEDGTVRLWDSSAAQCLKTLSAHPSGVRTVAFSPAGLLASGGDDQTMHLWESRTGSSLRILQGYMNRVWSLLFAHFLGWLVSASEDQKIRLWDVQAGRCVKILSTAGQGVRAVASSPVAPLLASTGGDQLVHL